MDTTQILTFFNGKAAAETSTSFPRVLRIYPQGERRGTELRLMATSGLPLADHLTAADRILAAVQEWRDSIADEIKRTRTAEDELAEARAEIARLKGEEVQS